MPSLKAGSSWFDVITQSSSLSCPMACAANVMKMMTGNYLSEKDFQNEVSAFRPVGGNYNAKGANPDHVISVLNKWKIKGAKNQTSDPGQIETYLKSASKSKPVILGVAWTSSGKHMIVSPGLNNQKTHWIALDPITVGTSVGAATEQDLNSLPEYVRGTLRGNIDLVITFTK